MTTNKRLTIYDIKYRTLESSPYFFDRKTLKFFGQTMRDFSVYKLDDNHYKISAPVRRNGKIVPSLQTVRIFNAQTNELERVSE